MKLTISTSSLLQVNSVRASRDDLAFMYEELARSVATNSFPAHALNFLFVHAQTRFEEVSATVVAMRCVW